ncbi:MAG: translocation/assembly module TamB domain-containing protein, partial [Candidatus Neomarinimicrobiota bacterium]
LFGEPAEGGEAEFIFAGDTVFTNYFRLYNGFDKLATSGFMIWRDSIQLMLDTLTVIRNSELLSTGRLLARWDVDRAVLKHQSFTLAGGVISLAADWRDAGDFSFQLSTSKSVDIERFYRLLGRPPTILGNLDLHVSASNRERNFRLSGNLIARDGHFNRIPFTKVKTEFELDDHRLSFPTLDWRTAEGQATITGTVTYLVDSENPLGLGKADSLQFSSQLTDYQFNDLQPYLPWRYETHGLATGSFSVGGLVTDPMYEAQLAFKAPRFDRITGDSLSGKMHYEDKTLSFSNLYLKSPTGVYAGGGTLPLDLRPGTPESEMIIDGPVDMTIAGIASQLDWFAGYFDAIDSLHGDFKLNLSLGGTWARLIRNGRLQVTNGRAELFVMENPITNITGDLLLQDNQFRVLHLSGRTPRETSGELFRRIRKRVIGSLPVRRGRDKSQLGVTGSLDMTEFFSPRFDLQLTGKEVYFSTALKEIEAVGTADFTITGKDLVSFRGDFVPEPGGLIIRKELAGPESYIIREPDEGTIIIYNIHVPFHTGAWVRNTEVDAEIEGELTLTAVGSEEFRYAGTVDAVGGDLIYNGYQFEIEEATVIFEPSQFNPQFTLRAVTEIPVGLEPVDVTLILTGTLEEPSMNFQYPPTISLTDSDLLSLFTLGDPAISEGDPALAATKGLGRIMLRESEQYARRVSGLDRFQIQTGSYRNPLGSEGLRFNLGKRLSPNVYVGLQADPTLNLNQYGYQVALRLSSTMSLEVSSRSPGLYEVNYRIKYRY